ASFRWTIALLSACTRGSRRGPNRILLYPTDSRLGLPLGGRLNGCRTTDRPPSPPRDRLRPRQEGQVVRDPAEWPGLVTPGDDVSDLRHSQAAVDEVEAFAGNDSLRAPRKRPVGGFGSQNVFDVVVVVDIQRPDYVGVAHRDAPVDGIGFCER